MKRSRTVNFVVGGMALLPLGCALTPSPTALDGGPPPKFAEFHRSPAADERLASTFRAFEEPVPSGELAATRPLSVEPPPVAKVAFVQEAPPPAESGPAAVVPLPAPPTGALTLAEIEQIALANNPSLGEAASQVEVARGNMIQAGLYPNPSTGYSGQQLGSPDAQQSGVYMQQEIVTGHKLALSREAAAWELERARREYAAQRLRVLTDVRVAYYEAAIAEERRDATAQLVDIAGRGVTTAQSLLEAQEVSKIDPLRARIESSNATILAQTAQNSYLAAWRRLAAVSGIPDAEPQSLADKVRTEDVRMTYEEVFAEILSQSPELSAAMANVQAANWSLQRAQVQAIPNFDVQGVVQYDNSVDMTNANLQVSLPIPIFDRNQGGIRAAQGQVAAAQFAVDRMTLDLQSRLADAYQRYANGAVQIEQYEGEDGVLANAQEALDLVDAGYSAGELTVNDLLVAQRTYFQTRLAYLDALREYSVAAAEMRGLLLRDSLGSGSGAASSPGEAPVPVTP